MTHPHYSAALEALAPTAEILALDAAWREANAACRAHSESQRPWMCDENRAMFDELSRQYWERYRELEDVRKAAFKARALALPTAGANVFISPRDWCANQDNWRTIYRAVKRFNNAPHYMDWYPCLASYEVDTITGEYFLRGAHMWDDCIAKATANNIELQAHYAKAA